MKRLQILLSFFAVAAICFSSQAQAQRSGFMRMMGGGGVQLDSSMLAMKEVQEELEFTEEQTKEIGEKAAELNDTMRSEMREIMMGGGDMSELEDVIKELKEEEQEFVALLNDEQKDRLKQLRFQRMGTAMYQDEEVQKTLELSDDKKKEIDDAIENNQEELQEAIQEVRDSGDFGSIRSTMADLQKELTVALNEILSDDQKEQVTKMKGKEFKFPERRRGRRSERSDF